MYVCNHWWWTYSLLIFSCHISTSLCYVFSSSDIVMIYFHAEWNKLEDLKFLLQPNYFISSIWFYAVQRKVSWADWFGRLFIFICIFSFTFLLPFLSNLYKHQKLLSVPEAFLPLVRRNGQPAAPQLMKEENEPHGPGGFNPNLSASGLDQFWGIPLIGLFSVLLVMGFLFYQVQQRRTRPRRRKPYRLKKSYPHASSSLHYGKMPAV